jgi:hypothetical protein
MRVISVDIWPKMRATAVVLSTASDPQNPALLPAAAAVIDGEIRNISLSDYRGKYVVLFWCVPASNCHVCCCST